MIDFSVLAAETGFDASKILQTLGAAANDAAVQAVPGLGLTESLATGYTRIIKDAGVLLIGIGLFLVGGIIIAFSFGDDLVRAVETFGQVAKSVPVE